MSDDLIPAASSFYDRIDEVLGPPPARLYRYGSGVMLLVLLLLAGVGLLLTVKQGIEGRASVGADFVQEVVSPSRDARVGGVLVRGGDTVRAGKVLAVFDGGDTVRAVLGDTVGAALGDTVRAPFGGIVKCQRLLTPGMIVPSGRPLFMISGLQAHYSVRIALLPLGYPAPGPDMIWIGKKVILQPQGEATVISDPYPDSALKYWMIDAEGTPVSGSGVAPGRPLSGPAFIITGRKSLLKDLFGF